jgi:hypothetical protein
MEPMMTLEELKALHASVWEFRRWMDANTAWKTPPRLDALMFAVTEGAGEALDSYLRIVGGYARNHAKVPRVEAELADCALMLLTALGPGDLGCSDRIRSELEFLGLSGRDVLLWLCGEIGGLPRGYLGIPALAKTDIIRCIWICAAYPGIDLPTEVHARMARLRVKHADPDAPDLPTIPGGFKRAAGILHVPEGTESPEDTIRRMREADTSQHMDSGDYTYGG